MPQAVAQPSKVLVMETDATRAAELSHRLRFLNYEPVIADSADALQGIDADEGIAVLVGETSADDELEAAASRMLANRPDLPVLVAGNVVQRPRLADREPWQLDMPLRRAQLSQLLKRAERYDTRGRCQRLTGNSRTIRKVRKLIEQVADFDTSVLVTGESGTGKELVARTIHDLSDRAGQAFVPINCGAIPAELLESELFGHDKGAFTGAVAARVGRFEMAEGGTLFLDEIGDMSLPMQVKLLRVLQERSFERVGSNRSRRCNVRIVAATHRDLPAMVAAGEFREDLYYRLNVFPIEMPPLCKRAADLPELLSELLLQHEPGSEGKLRLSADALAALARYDWPGNIRELGNLVERLAIMYPEGEIGLEELPAKYRQPGAASAAQPAAAVPPQSGNLKQYLQEVERRLIEQALSAADGVVAQAARQLNMQRTTLLEKIGRYGLGD